MAWICGSAAMSASLRVRIMRMMFCTISEPLAPSITSVRRMAGATRFTASSAEAYWAPSTMSAHSTSSARSGASKPKRSRATVAMYMVQERKLGSYIFLPLVSRRKCSASSGVRKALW